MSARALSRSRMDAQVTLQCKVYEIAIWRQASWAEHDPKKACPELDPGAGIGFRKKIMLKQKPAGTGYSALMLASRITLPHFAESARMRAAKASGELTIE